VNTSMTGCPVGVSPTPLPTMPGALRQAVARVF
jgi:hypothetical protein